MRPRRPALTSEERDQVIEALGRCSSAAAVSRSMEGVSPSMVKKVAKQEGIVLRDGHASKGSRNRIPAGILQRAVELLREKRNAAEVSREFRELSHSTLSRIARQEGIVLTASQAKGGGPHIAGQKLMEIAQAVKVDPNAVHVAAKLGGVSATTVRRVARQQQIPLTAGMDTKFRPSISDETRASIVSALLETPNAAAVARQFGGVSEAVVRKVAHTEHIDLVLGKAVRKQPRLSAETEKMIADALRANSNAKQVAREIQGATHMIVRRIAKTQGIDLVAGRTSGRGDRKSSNPRKPTAAVQAPASAEVTDRPDEAIQSEADPQLSTEAKSFPLLPVGQIGDRGNLNKSSGKLSFATENLVRALDRARISGDRKRLDFLVSTSDHDLLRAALDVIRASKARLATPPSPRG